MYFSFLVMVSLLLMCLSIWFFVTLNPPAPSPRYILGYGCSASCVWTHFPRQQAHIFAFLLNCCRRSSFWSCSRCLSYQQRHLGLSGLRLTCDLLSEPDRNLLSHQLRILGAVSMSFKTCCSFGLLHDAALCVSPRVLRAGLCTRTAMETS